MHQYKTIAQTLLVLSILNLVFAAPIPRDTLLGGSAPSQDPSPSSDGSPPHNSLPLEGSAPSSGSSPLSDLPATDAELPVYDSTIEAPTSARPLSAAGGPTPESYSITPGSNSPSYSSATDREPPVLDSIVDASTSSRPSSATDSLVSTPDLTGEGSTTTPDTPVTKTKTKFLGLSMPTERQIMKYGTDLTELAVLIPNIVYLIEWEKKKQRKQD